MMAPEPLKTDSSLTATLCTATFASTRVSLAHTLLEQEAAASQLGQPLKDSQTTPSKLLPLNSSKPQSHTLSLTLEFTRTQKESARHQTQLALYYTQQLRLETEKIRGEVAHRKAENQKRRNELVAARNQLARLQTAHAGRFEKSVAGIRNRWNSMHTKIAESRLLLCREAASLFGLKRQHNHVAISKPEDFLIGALPVFNLKDLNNADPAIVTTVTSNLAYLVHLVSHYLALRLPAQVILPHPDHPFPIILAPALSYVTSDSASHPNTASMPSSFSHPPAVRGLLHASQKRGTTSLLKKRLSATAKEDPQTYTAVVEAITLLAWNVAWLCKTQGFDVGASTWEETCDVGKNLWLLLGPERAGPLHTSGARDRIANQDFNINTDRRVSQPGVKPSPAIMFASGSKVIDGWRLQNPVKVIKEVKHMLLSDRTGAEWEMLEDKEWGTQSMMPKHTTPTAALGASTVVIDGKHGAEKPEPEPEQEPSSLGTDDAQEKAKGTSGWTKLKSR
ncbi:MAG: hypothetical protein Q9209_000791 [Squamulea sp. 1 TL-2023]